MNHLNLDQRLKQRGRRSGAIVGVSIMAAIALGILTFVFIYSLVEPFTTDFVSKTEVDSGDRDRQPAKKVTATFEPTTQAAEAITAATGTPEITVLGNPNATAENSTFDADYRVSASRRINLRSGPGTNSAVVAVLPAGVTLEFMDDQRVTGDPQRDSLPRGGRWLKFRTEQGDEGWIREVDVTPIAG